MSQGGTQQSEESSTRNGISALETAYSGVQRILQDVESTKNNLSTSYQGSDGGAYGKLLDLWDDQVVVILKNLEDMIDKLNTSLTQHNLAQGSGREAIDQAFSASEAAFDALSGSGAIAPAG
ncbi:hypothetical protein [Streptomyces fulvoviolaceus]|uniref:hypothetical protein n=1 Tax=Streptomyces fulvoviolaceus TaxID=285535 RepID=UPI0004C636DF|nr:hypothetical protein [Streptomyces fulvoviolaceus]MCT9084301.1 hypothetical protein [Streptomyces fulvoviolaceus]